MTVKRFEKFSLICSNSLSAIRVNLLQTCTVFLSSYTNTSGSLGEREMLWEHEPSSPKLSRVFV